MMLKVNGEYLNLLPGEQIEIDKQVKLFEELSAADGDFSYSFKLPDTNWNRTLLSIQDINISGKQVYSGIECDIQSDSGISIYAGLLKIERYEGNIIECSFASGNTNWISLIEGDLKDLNLSVFDVENDITNIEASWTADSGLVFPVVDKGNLEDRIGPSLALDDRPGEDLYLNNDFHPFIFVHDVMKAVFDEAGLKLSGALLQDWRYKKLITTNNAGNSQELLESRSSYVGKTSTQSINSGSFTKLTFIDNSSPYYDGDNDNFDNSTDTWTADAPCVIRIVTHISYADAQRFAVSIYRNGVSYRTGDYLTSGGSFGTVAVDVVAGDYFEVYAKPFTTNTNVSIGSTVKIDVIRLKKIFAVDVLPDFTKINFVKNIFRIFNVVPTYDRFSKTVNLELFKTIRNKEPQNLSQYVSDIKLDYYEFLNEYGRKNWLTYSESSSEEIEEYNLTNTVPFGGGSIDLNNSYLQDEASLADLDFVAPYQYFNDNLQMSLLKLNYVDETETEEDVLNSVTDNGGTARFNFSGVPPFSSDDGDIIRIKETSTGNYIGTAVVTASGIGFFELAGVPYQGDCTGTFVKINYSENSNSDPVLAIYMKSQSVNYFSNLYQGLYVDITLKFDMAYAYFFKHYQGGISIDAAVHGLSFGDLTGQGFYQQTLKESYYSELDQMLNDPVKAIATMNLPENVFYNLDFTRPVRIDHKKASGLFYLNKIRGYKASHLPCLVELIKM